MRLSLACLFLFYGRLQIISACAQNTPQLKSNFQQFNWVCVFPHPNEFVKNRWCFRDLLAQFNPSLWTLENYRLRLDLLRFAASGRRFVVMVGAESGSFLEFTVRFHLKRSEATSGGIPQRETEETLRGGV